MMKLVTKSVKMPSSLAAALESEARRRNISESELIRRGIEEVASGSGGIDMAAMIAADIGGGKGPRDLSSNRAHLSAYGTSRNR